MRIAVWNIDTPAREARSKRLLEWIDRINADIWVLTNTTLDLRPSVRHQSMHTERASGNEPGTAAVAIWCRYPIRTRVATADPTHTVATVITQPSGGELLVYAAGRAAQHNDLASDLRRLKQEFPNAELCIAGQMDVKRFARAFGEADLSCVTQGYEDPVFAQTAGQSATTDHIVVSASLAERDTSRGCWPAGTEPLPELSSHFGIYVDFE